MAFSSRRRFLAELSVFAGVAAVTSRLGAQGGLEKFVIPSPPCTEADLTPAVADAGTFKAGSPARTSLVEPGVTARRIVLSGFVIGIKCGRVKDAQLEFWHADPGGTYDMQGFLFRGQQRTDTDGRYRLETVMPGAAGARPPVIAARLTPPGQPALTTLLFFPDTSANARDPRFASKLVMKKGSNVPTPSEKPGETGQAFTFDFILNL